MNKFIIKLNYETWMIAVMLTQFLTIFCNAYLRIIYSSFPILN